MDRLWDTRRVAMGAFDRDSPQNDETLSPKG